MEEWRLFQIVDDAVREPTAILAWDAYYSCARGWDFSPIHTRPRRFFCHRTKGGNNSHRSGKTGNLLKIPHITNSLVSLYTGFPPSPSPCTPLVYPVSHGIHSQNVIWCNECAGDYQVSIKFNDQSIPDSPFDVFVAPSDADSTRLDITDLDEQVLEVR